MVSNNGKYAVFMVDNARKPVLCISFESARLEITRYRTGIYINGNTPFHL